ncbi:5675_t:CDS:2 [Paraglomus brasilianum]|uniref:5675_t:CDS:1 n=1 Tax=Paraglomus brasilianum TaxID=144538 RepID=A0A9N9DF52_9GLOM|nr:5675_t:CDS:2 [Paraglomus brasilianum]
MFTTQYYGSHYANIIQELSTIGIKTERDLLLAKDEFILSKTNISPEDYYEFKREVIATCKVPVRRGLSLIEEHQRSLLSTGCIGLDNILEGGLRVGEIADISGAAGTGKTQLAHFISLATITSSFFSTADPSHILTPTLSSVIYIDTTLSFHPTRIRDLYLHSDKFADLRDIGVDVGVVLSRLKIYRCFDVYDVLETVESVRKELESGRGAEKQWTEEDGAEDEERVEDDKLACCQEGVWDEREENANISVKDGKGNGNDHGETKDFYGRLKLIVIDSVSAVLSGLVQTSHSQGYSLMMTLTQMLQHMARTYNILILTVKTLSAFSAVDTKPALGTTWTHLPSLQLYLSRCADEERVYTNRDGEGITVQPRVCEVLRARTGVMGLWCLVYMGDNEIFAPEPGEYYISGSDQESIY